MDFVNVQPKDKVQYIELQSHEARACLATSRYLSLVVIPQAEERWGVSTRASGTLGPKA
jgi:hypothetical protein